MRTLDDILWRFPLAVLTVAYTIFASGGAIADSLRMFVGSAA